jgi:hypothetical protein
LAVDVVIAMRCDAYGTKPPACDRITLMFGQRAMVPDVIRRTAARVVSSRKSTA